MTTEADKLRHTLFLLSPSWHGATLLSMLLGNHSRVYSCGDTIPARIPFRCRCGKSSDACAFWTEVRQRVGVSAADSVIPARPSITGYRSLDHGLVLLGSSLARYLHLPAPGCGQVIRANSIFLDCCGESKPFDIFVDGCKSISRYAAIKSGRRERIRGILHLIRDPRAFAAAAKKRGMSADDACRYWGQQHHRIDRVAALLGEDVMTLRYEDFCAAPEVTLQRIQVWLKLEPESLLKPFGRDRHWTGSGSVRKFDGTVELSDRWRTELTRQEIALLRRKLQKTARRWGYRLDQDGI